MAFVTERIPESEKQRIAAPVYTRPTGSKPTLWAIDRDRDAFVILINAVGGAYDGTPPINYYILNWGGSIIWISAAPLPKTYLGNGSIMSWKIKKVTITPTLSRKKEEVLQVICDAFAAIGESFDGNRYAAVNVEFDSSCYGMEASS